MKLALPLLLVTLALCCSDADAAEVCPALNSAIKDLLLATKRVYYENLKQFDAPEEAVQAKMQVKRCVDTLPRMDRLAVVRFAKALNVECKKQTS